MQVAFKVRRWRGRGPQLRRALGEGPSAEVLQIDATRCPGRLDIDIVIVLSRSDDDLTQRLCCLHQLSERIDRTFAHERVDVGTQLAGRLAFNVGGVFGSRVKHLAGIPAGLQRAL